MADELEFAEVSKFELIWNDKGSRCSLIGSFYRPEVPEGWFFLGDYGQPDYAPPSGSVKIVRVAEGADPSALASPVGWKRTWADSRTGAERDGSFWVPTPPPGYEVCGHVIQEGHDNPPHVERFRCVRSNLVEELEASEVIWTDQGCGGSDRDIAIWRVAEIGDFVTRLDDRTTPPKTWVPKDLMPRPPR